MPAICVAEFLHPLTPDYRARQIKALETWTLIAAFDGKAIGIAANLSKLAIDEHKLEKLADPNSEFATSSRQLIKTDVLILATAISHDSSHFYTTNAKHFTRIAGGLIEICELVPPQPQLFSGFRTLGN